MALSRSSKSLRDLIGRHPTRLGPTAGWPCHEKRSIKGRFSTCPICWTIVGNSDFDVRQGETGIWDSPAAIHVRFSAPHPMKVTPPFAQGGLQGSEVAGHAVIENVRALSWEFLMPRGRHAQG